jgi:sugar O-acyltransferase (sialic acid O-acetyltransferase NeuD family)
MKKEKLAIIGAGDLGQLLSYHAFQDGHYDVAGFFDDFRTKDEIVSNFRVLGNTSEIFNVYKNGVFDVLMIAIGYKHIEIRKQMFDKYFSHIPIGKVIHSSVYADPSSSISAGSFILPGCIIDRNVKIEENVLLNTGCVIAHDSSIRSHSFLSPGVNVAGFVTIGECCNIGINSTIIDNIKITSNVQTGGGTVVIKNLELSGLYVGNPARFIR